MVLSTLKQGTQNNTSFLDFQEKNPKWQYNQHLSDGNCLHVPATAVRLIHWMIFSHCRKSCPPS